MTLEQDIKLSSEAFKTAANEMSALKTRAETLKTTLCDCKRTTFIRTIQR